MSPERGSEISNAMFVAGGNIQARQRAAFHQLTSTVRHLERQNDALRDYVRVLERDTESLVRAAVTTRSASSPPGCRLAPRPAASLVSSLAKPRHRIGILPPQRTGKVVPKEVVDGLEEHFAAMERDAKRVPGLETELKNREDAVAQTTALLLSAQEEVTTLRARVEGLTAERAELAAKQQAQASSLDAALDEALGGSAAGSALDAARRRQHAGASRDRQHAGGIVRQPKPPHAGAKGPGGDGGARRVAAHVVEAGRSVAEAVREAEGPPMPSDESTWPPGALRWPRKQGRLPLGRNGRRGRHAESTA